MKTKDRKLFHGWWIVFGAAFALLFGSAPIVFFSFAAFLNPFSKEFHLTRAGVSLAFSSCNMAASLCIPVTGWLIDTIGPRKMVIFCTGSFAALLMCMPLIIRNRWGLYAFFAALGVVGSGAGVLPYAAAISRWFNRKRGIALGLAMGGLAVGTTIVPFLAQRMIPRHGWRHTYEFFGLIVGFCSLPLIARVLRDHPASLGLEPDGFKLPTDSHGILMEQTGVSWPEARSTQTFWKLAGSFWIVGACLQGCVVHLGEILKFKATSLPFTATLLLGPAMLIGRLGSGYLVDYLFGPKIGTCLFSAVSIALVLLWFRNTYFAVVAVILIGLAIGAEAELLAYLVSRYFGLRAFGQIFGYCWAGFILAGALGAYAIGFGFDATQTYGSALLVCSVAMLVAAILISLLGHYRYSQDGTSAMQAGWTIGITTAVKGTFGISVRKLSKLVKRTNEEEDPCHRRLNLKTIA